MSKPKIAICLSAEPRYWKRASESISALKKAHPECQIDVFYHFWNNITKRQSHLIDDTVIESVDSNRLQDQFDPVVGICESKSGLDPHLEEAWRYIEKLKVLSVEIC